MGPGPGAAFAIAYRPSLAAGRVAGALWGRRPDQHRLRLRPLRRAGVRGTVTLFLAQILSHCTGAVFNYAMFRRHVFTDSGGAVGRYIGAYAVNYGLGLAGLALFHRFVASPYLAGFLALVVVAAINFFILRLLVFRKTPAATPPPA